MKKFNCYKALAAMVVFTLAAAACSDDMVEPDPHPEAEGVQLIMGGNVIASYDGETQTWTGELEVDAGEETPHIRVVFVDHDGDPVELEDDTYLEVDIEDTSIAEFEQDTPGEFGGHLHGHMAGETDVTFKLMHGQVGSGHADFVTQPVHAHVHEHEG
ncbi:MAG: hypothetical protein F4139_04995 [Gemmatimonadetes bacterium]|nr:hypothetical protein [Gemmatimonadota bacterium]MYA63355.1 hypothetical protein [Gemmatimonadota bacterium]MYC00082.1 hypothetical protein [Gemmatimonadota bacterium]MYH52291.1 hypothetical protein [Gemmatimonadota bacterium]MYI45222.1 hypothetical protein [Gemmatimonadota bacterium]